MAFQRDYVLRMIEMMGEFFRRLGDLLDEKEQMRALNDACREQCGLSLDAALALSVETLEGLLPPSGLMMLSELSYLQSQLPARDEEKRQALLLRTLRLLCALSGEEALCLERSARLRELMDACENDLTAEDYLACARFFMAGEHFEQGEDALFLGAEIARDPRVYVLQGVALLRRLLLLSDSVLITGGLPREDVLRAINDLEAWEKR